MYKSGDKIWFQFHPDYEDTNWYPGTIVEKTPYSKCYRISVKGRVHYYFAPENRIKIRNEDVDEQAVFEELHKMEWPY